MNNFPLAGNLTSAFSHLALAGVAAILVDAADQGRLGDALARTWWSDESESQPMLATSLSEGDIGDVVRDHATRHTEPASWVTATASSGARSGKGLFSPRLPAGGVEELGAFAAERQSALSRAETAGLMTELDWRMLAGLGEPAWWRYTEKECQPDMGASRWEMKTRNRGEEFVGNRLPPLALAVASRSIDEVWVGLIGQALVDELGRGDRQSRTPTGLTRPGPVDSALAWCALWGVSMMPTAHVSVADGRERGFSQSAGVWPRNRVHPTHACLPVFSDPVSPNRFRSLVSTAALDVAAFGALRGETWEVARSKAWLARQGARALIRFPVVKGGSDSAPERHLQEGVLERL